MLHLEQRILGAGDAQGAAGQSLLLGFIEREQHFGRTVSQLISWGSCWLPNQSGAQPSRPAPSLWARKRAAA